MKGGFRSDTPSQLTGNDREKWLSEEIGYICDLQKSLKVLFKENEAGIIDQYRIMSNLFITEEYLRRYSCNLSEQLQEEKHHQTEQAEPQKETASKMHLRKIISLKDYSRCRAKQTVNIVTV